MSLPDEHWDQTGEVAVSTCPTCAVGTTVEPGEVLRLDGRSVVVLKER